MAFVSIVFVLIVIMCIILGALFISGLVFFIIGVVRKKNPKNKGKKSPVVCIVIGSILLFLPLMTTLVLMISGVTSSIFTNIKRTGYENVTDKWRNEWVSDNVAAEDAIDALLTAAEAGDREAFARMFTPNIQNDEDFNATLDEFFASYPSGLAECKLDGGCSGSSGSYDHGSNVETGGASYTCMLNGKWYYIGMNFCYENTDSPDDVGVEFFCIENLEAYALDEDYAENEHLACNIVSEDDVSARLIGGHGFIFEPTPERVITEAEMREYLEKYDDLDDLSDEIGAPNVRKKYDNCTGCENYYELVPENGEPRYAYICAGYPGGEFYYGYICSDTEPLYDRSLFPDE